jgi:CDP-diacylglycerol--glycerol-3-phosphate 3-phosphatidyltransferase
LPLNPDLYWFRDGFMYVTIALTVVTGAYYVRSAFKPKS